MKSKDRPLRRSVKLKMMEYRKNHKLHTLGIREMALLRIIQYRNVTVSGYCEKFYSNKFDNLDDMEKLLMG